MNYQISKNKDGGTRIDTLDVQRRILNNMINQGFNLTGVPLDFCLLYGEVAEAFEAYRRGDGNLGSELADVGIYLLSISEMLGYNLGKEIEDKMSVNEQRRYVRRCGVLVKDSEATGEPSGCEAKPSVTESDISKHRYVAEQSVFIDDIEEADRDKVLMAMQYANSISNRTAYNVGIEEARISPDGKQLIVTLISDKALHMCEIPRALRVFTLYLLDKKSPAYLGDKVDKDRLLNLTTATGTDADEEDAARNFERLFPDGMK